MLLEFDIEADARRLFGALTEPEYIETWLRLPGDHRGCPTSAARVGQNFVIEHQCGGAPSTYIAGTYSACNRHNICFSWRVEGNFAAAESYADISLKGNFEHTTLILQHGGFQDAVQYAWHRALWMGSIGQLIELYDTAASISKISQAKMLGRGTYAANEGAGNIQLRNHIE